MSMMPVGWVFLPGRPFFKMVNTFMASAVGLGPIFDPNNPLKLDNTRSAVFYGYVISQASIDMQQVRDQALSGGTTGHDAVISLCCMFVNSTYEEVGHQNDHSPEFEVFRHLRNAASHQNRFHFKPHEPRRPAAWRGFVIDHNQKGSSNPLHGTPCFGTKIGPADIIFLLSDIESKLP
jgi:hypothetical protein